MKENLFDRTLKSVFTRAIQWLDSILPPEKPTKLEMYARDAFELACMLENEGMRTSAAQISKTFLKDGGYDVDTDKPYRDVLGLKGGKAEFDKIFSQPPKPV
jgi:hypothetical protein